MGSMRGKSLESSRQVFYGCADTRSRSRSRPRNKQRRDELDEMIF